MIQNAAFDHIRKYGKMSYVKGVFFSEEVSEWQNNIFLNVREKKNCIIFFNEAHVEHAWNRRETRTFIILI